MCGLLCRFITIVLWAWFTAWWFCGIFVCYSYGWCLVIVVKGRVTCTCILLWYRAVRVENRLEKMLTPRVYEMAVWNSKVVKTRYVSLCRFNGVGAITRRMVGRIVKLPEFNHGGAGVPELWSVDSLGISCSLIRCHEDIKLDASWLFNLTQCTAKESIYVATPCVYSLIVRLRSTTCTVSGIGFVKVVTCNQPIGT
jgi:hypothetical protein